MACSPAGCGLCWASLVTAPLIAGIIKPLVRGTVKTIVTLGLQTQKLAAEAREELQDIAAEASADMATRDGQLRGVGAPRRGAMS